APRVIDGDTFDCIVDLGFNVTIYIRVRLARINAPELRGPEQQRAQLAKNFVIASLTGIFAVTFVKFDDYGRYVCDVWYESGSGEWHNLSDDLLHAGLADPYPAV